MKTKNENLVQNDKLAREAYLATRFTCLFVFGCSFLAVCLTTSGGHAETSLKELDPVNLLEAQFAAASQSVNTPNTPVRPEASAIRYPVDDGSADFRILEPPVQIAKPGLNQHKTQTNSSAAVNFAARFDEKSRHLLIAKNPTTGPGRQLWQARITNPKNRVGSESKIQLQRIIEQIHSVEFTPQPGPPEPLIVAEPIQKTEPNETLSQPEVMQPPQSQEAESGHKPSLDSEQQNEDQMPYQPVTEETLQMLKDLSQHPQQLKTPFELAEVLFNSGCLKEAAKCYRQALNRMTADETDQNENKAWILFQIGNCLRNTDPPTAIEMYRQLIAEYGDSPWVDSAKARNKLINWYQQDKPAELVAENRF